MSNLLSLNLTVKSLLYGVFGFGLLVFAFVALADQLNMENALASLRSARQSLVQADSNKGGHRAAAIKLVDQAISEVQAGLATAGK